jgi:hypothetical protein
MKIISISFILTLIINLPIHSEDIICPKEYGPKAFECYLKEPIPILISEGNKSFRNLKKYHGSEVNLGITFDYFSAACKKGSKYGCKRAYDTIKIFGDHNGISLFEWSLIYRSPNNFKTYLLAETSKFCNKKCDKILCNSCLDNPKNCKGCFIKCALYNPYPRSLSHEEEPKLKKNNRNSKIDFLLIIFCIIFFTSIVIIFIKKNFISNK